MNNFNGLGDMNELASFELNNKVLVLISGGRMVGKTQLLHYFHAFAHLAIKINKAQKNPVFYLTVSTDEEKLQKAIELTKTQSLNIYADSEICESNNLRQIISNKTTEFSFNNVLNLSLFKLFLLIDNYELIDQTSADSKFAHDVMAICFAVIRYILAFIRYLLSIKLFSSIVQALHRICYIPHSLIHGPGNTDDEHSNPLHSITARLFSSRKGNALLTSLSPG